MTLRVEYQDVLKRYLDERCEIDLLKAYELGKRFQAEQMSPDVLIGMHLEALTNMPEGMTPEQQLTEVLSSFNVLIETMIAYGIAFSEAHRLLEQTAREAEEAKYELEKIIVELDLAYQQLQDVDRLKNRFFANMSHELRTPLNAIIGFAEDALDGLAGELNPKQARFIDNILRAARHLLSVINEILDLAKIQAGRVRLDLKDVALHEVLAEVEATMQPLVSRKEQMLRIEVSEALPKVRADASRVYQILMNLLSNAHKYTPEGGTITVSAAPEEEDGCLRVAVRDTGVGIPESELPTIFEEFRQVNMMRKPRQQGTGLGLAITKGLIELQGGSIQAESEVDRGSTFSFRLPLAAEGGGPDDA